MAEVLVSTPPVPENIQAEDTVNDKFNCSYCGKNYSSANSLKTHIKWHTGDLKHKCNYCDKKFRNFSELRRHEMVHTGERPNKCCLCERQFIQKHALKDHIRKRHPESFDEFLAENTAPLTTAVITDGTAVINSPASANSTFVIHTADSVINTRVAVSTIPSVQMQQQQQSVSLKSAAYSSKQNLSFEEDLEDEEGNLTCRFCQREFQDEYLLLQHEEEEAREFQALHDSFEKKEFGELETFSLQEYLGHSEAAETVADPDGGIKNNNNIEKLEYISIDLETLQSHVVPHMKLETSSGPINVMVDAPPQSSAPLQLVSSAPLRQQMVLHQQDVSSLQPKQEPAEFHLKRSEPVILQQKMTNEMLPRIISTNHIQPQSILPNNDPKLSANCRRVISTNHNPGGLSANESPSILSSLLSSAKPNQSSSTTSCSETGSTTSEKTGFVGGICLPSLPLPLRSIDPGKIPLNINRHSLDEMGLPCPAPNKQTNLQDVVSPNDLEFFHSLEKKYNYLDLKLGLPGTGPLIIPAVKCEPEGSSSSSCSSRSSSTPVDTILVSHVTQDQHANPESRLSSISQQAQVANLHQQAQVATLNQQPQMTTLNHQAQVATMNQQAQVATMNQQVQVATMNQQVQVATMNQQAQVATMNQQAQVATRNHDAQQVVTLVPEQQSRVMTYSELGFIQPSTLPAADAHGVEIVRMSPVQLPFAKRSSPSTMFAVKGSSPDPMFAVKGSSPVPMFAVKGSSPAPMFAVKGSSPAPMFAEKGSSPAPMFAVKGSSPAPMFKQEMKLETAHHLDNQGIKVEPTAFVSMDAGEMHSLAIKQEYKTEIQEYKTEQEYIKTEQVPAVNKDQDIGAFCQGLLNGMDESTWSLLNPADFQMNRAPGAQTISLNPVPHHQQQDAAVVVVDQHLYENTQYQLVNQFSRLSDENGLPPLQENGLPPLQDPDLQESDWSNDCTTIPSGWMIRYVDYLTGNKIKKRTHFLSPEGHVFQSRKEAIDYLVRTNAAAEDLAALRRGLKMKAVALDWKAGEDDVPEDWKVREVLSTDKKLRIFFLSPGGLSFPCRQAAYDHMVKVGTYSPSDVMLMGTGLKEKVGRGSGTSKDKLFSLGDPSLPPGWKNRVNSQGRENFRSPSGQFFHTRQAIVDFMLAENFPQDQIDLVSSKIEKKSRSKSGSTSTTPNKQRPEKEWKENDPTVPVGWRMRQITTNEGLTITTFLTPEGVTIRGRKAALNHMVKTGLYSSDDVELMRQYSNVLCKISDTWVTGDPSLPAGWRIRKYNSKPTSKRVHCDFLSPENHVIRSRKGVLEHMRRTGGYTQADYGRVEAAQNRPERRKTEDVEPLPGASAGTRVPYDATRTFGAAARAPTAAAARTAAAQPITDDGAWAEANFLPAGWLERSGTWMSPDNQIFWSSAEVVAHMENSTSISSIELARITRQFQLNQPDQTKPSHDQTKPSHDQINSPDVIVPPRYSGGGETIGRGWKLGPNLPKGWRMKTHFWGNREKHLFRSPEGKVFNSRKLAVEWVESAGILSPEDLERFRAGPRKRKRKENLWINGRRKSKVLRTTKRPSTEESAENLKKEKKAKQSPDTTKTPAPTPKMSTRNSGRKEKGKYENILAGKDLSKIRESHLPPLQGSGASVDEKPVVIEPVQDIVEDDLAAMGTVQSINHSQSDVFLHDELDKSLEEI